jgi:hypothetical protein
MSETKVNADVRIIPAKRSASYDVPILLNAVRAELIEQGVEK